METRTRNALLLTAHLAAAVFCCAAARAQVVAPKKPAPVSINKPAPGPPVTLSVKNPVASSEAYLQFFSPRSVDFKSGIAEFKATEFWQDGSVWVFFKPDAPGKHQLDCEVERSASGVFTLTVPEWAGKINPTPVEVGNNTRAVFTFELPDAGRRAFVLLAGVRWKFKRCEVTRLN